MDEKNTAPCQLISFVADNSASMSKEKLGELAVAFGAFEKEMASFPAVEWELLFFGGFEPNVVKSFDAAEMSAVAAGGLPLLGRAVTTAANRLSARADELRAKGCTVYRPWMFILSDGFTLDDMEETITHLDAMEHEGKLLYLPFKLTEELLTERMQSLDRIKRMIGIKEGGLEAFFQFVKTIIERRMALPPETGIKFQKTDFEGWAVL